MTSHHHHKHHGGHFRVMLPGRKPRKITFRKHPHPWRSIIWLAIVFFLMFYFGQHLSTAGNGYGSP